MTAIALAAAAGVAALAATPRADRTILVTVLDKAGRALKDITAADLSVSDGGASRTVIAVKPAADPLFVIVMVDNSQPVMGGSAPTGELRTGLTAFVNAIHEAGPDNQIELKEIGGASVTTAPFTSEPAPLLRAINKLLPNQREGAVLLEGLVDASKEIVTRPGRRAIVSVTFNSQETSTVDARSVAETAQRTGASFWAISVQWNESVSASSSGSSATREAILDKVTDATGGVRVTAVSTAALEGLLKTMADNLTSQYEVTFSRPDGVPLGPIQPKSKRGVKVLMSPMVR